MTFAIIGASGGLGRALAETFATAGHDLLLAARNSRDLSAIANDLSIRHGIEVTTVAVDLAETDDVTRLIEMARNCSSLKGVLLPLGMADDEDNGDLAPEAVQKLLQVNLLSVILLTQAFALFLREQGGGVIVGFGSIAAARGRGSNMVYSAAKRGLESWFESFRHYSWRAGVRVQFYIPGYLTTTMTYGRKTPLPPASASIFAERVLRNIGKDIGASYFPSYWRPIALALRLIPWSLYKRIRF